jgi:hypothetical protein
MTVPAPISDHTQQALARLVTPLKGDARPLFAAWCASHIDQWQDLEDAMQVWLASFDVDTCDEPRLTILGKLVGQTPVGSLETFRRMVKARIQVNRSNGTGPTLIRIARLLFDGEVWFDEGDCDITIYAREPLPGDVDGTILANLLRLAKMAGVGLLVVAQGEEDGLLLGDDTSYLTDDPAHGLADGASDGTGTTTGGYLAGDY